MRMLMLLRGALLLGLIGLWIWCILDVIRTEAEPIKHLHKLVWLALVILVPTVGSIAWLVVGRPVPIGSKLIPPAQQQRPAPDDSPEFLRQVDEEIRRRRRADQLRRPDPEPRPDQAEIDEELRGLEEQFRKDAEGDDGPKG